MRGRCEKRAHDGPPFGEQGRLAKPHGVVFQVVPKDLQDVALGAFDAPVHLAALKALGLASYRVQAQFNGFFKFGLLAGVDADVCEFEN